MRLTLGKVCLPKGDAGLWVAMRRGCKRLDTSTQGEYTKTKAAYENLKDFNVSKRQSQILPLRPSFLTREVVTGNDMGDETVAQICSAS
jgi:hypothetical protein